MSYAHQQEGDKKTGHLFVNFKDLILFLFTIYLQGNILLIEDQDDTNIAPLIGPSDPTDPDQYDYITKAVNKPLGLR